MVMKYRRKRAQTTEGKAEPRWDPKGRKKFGAVRDRNGKSPARRKTEKRGTVYERQLPSKKAC